MPIIAAVYLFCYFSKNHICSRLILSFSTKIFLNIQWGNSSVTTENTDGTLIYYPIAFKYNVFGVVATDRGGGCYSWGASEYNINNFRAWARNVGVFTLATGAWFSVGR